MIKKLGMTSDVQSPDHFGVSIFEIVKNDEVMDNIRVPKYGHINHFSPLFACSSTILQYFGFKTISNDF